MKRFWFWLGVVGLVGIPLRLAYLLHRDITNPHTWSDPMYDPRLYGFTSRPIAEALVAARARGVEVEVVLDKSNASARYSEAGFVAGNGVSVRIDSRYAIMHSKYIVIDGVTVETGSFNFTSAASEKNAENIVIVRGYPETARRYEENWIGLWNESEPFK